LQNKKASQQRSQQRHNNPRQSSSLGSVVGDTPKEVEMILGMVL